MTSTRIRSYGVPRHSATGEELHGLGSPFRRSRAEPLSSSGLPVPPRLPGPSSSSTTRGRRRPRPFTLDSAARFRTPSSWTRTPAQALSRGGGHRGTSGGTLRGSREPISGIEHGTERALDLGSKSESSEKGDANFSARFASCPHQGQRLQLQRKVGGGRGAPDDERGANSRQQRG